MNGKIKLDDGWMAKNMRICNTDLNVRVGLYLTICLDIRHLITFKPLVIFL